MLFGNKINELFEKIYYWEIPEDFKYMFCIYGIPPAYLFCREGIKCQEINRNRPK